MYFEITDDQNKEFLNHLEEFNSDNPIPDKITMDCYINSIEIGKETIFYCTRIEAIVPTGCTKDNIKINSYSEIGDKVVLKLSKVDKDLQSVMRKFIRGLKIEQIV